MYLVTKTNINPKHELYGYCSTMTALSKNIYNAALFVFEISLPVSIRTHYLILSKKYLMRSHLPRIPTIVR